MAKVHEAGTSEDLRQNVVSRTSDVAVMDRPKEGGPYDEFYVSPEDRKAYGIQESETPFWARDPDFWMQRGENVNRVKQLEASTSRGGMDARLIQTSEFDKVHIGGGTTGDLVLMAIPNEVKAQQQREIDLASREYQSSLTQTEEGWEGHENTMDWDNLGPRMRKEHEFNQQTGLIGQGSPTQGMTFTQAAAYMAKRQSDVADKQEMLRNGGHFTTPDLDGFQRLMSGQKRLHGMGNSGFPRNPNSAVAQAARRQNGGK